MAKLKIQDVDLYALLDLEIAATESEIKKAYRKKALQCHPDKNPDDPKAAETFHELSKALEILTDASARNAYDKVLKAKQAAKLRHKELDSKRQKLKDDLERKEREADLNSKLYKTFDNRTDEEKLQAEVERLQKEGSRLLEEEQRRMQQEINKQSERLNPEWDSSANRIKIKWSASKTDETNGRYNEEVLRRCLKKYGDIVALIISCKKKGSALVEYATKEASEMAIEFEKGLPDNPLTLKWVSSSAGNKSSTATQSTLVSDRDYESLVLTKLRQAAERQKLIEQMLKEDE